ncbi:hypothetical protein N4G37_13625, partial [Enterococcus faecalis]|uniref:hypothetical protein n=1 Tax=Enterococcus faecalis TaxID=1351 RepID=UPI0021B13D72
LNTASVYWDYYQFDEAINIINLVRKDYKDNQIYALQAGKIYEDKHMLKAAITEYVKAASNQGPELRQNQRLAQKRLGQLYSDNSAVIENA